MRSSHTCHMDAHTSTPTLPPARPIPHVIAVLTLPTGPELKRKYRRCFRSLHIRIWRMRRYLYRYIPVSWPTWEKMYCKPSASWNASTLPSLWGEGGRGAGGGCERLHQLG